jgi:hypothetical protein
MRESSAESVYRARGLMDEIEVKSKGHEERGEDPR